MPAPDLAFLDRLADVADAVTLPLFRTRLAIDVKRAGAGDIDPVTDADRGAERAMRAEIERAFPDHGIAGEEFPPVNPDAREIWHLDPIDGTRQFIAGVPLWTTMAGLSVGGSPTIGLVSQPFTRERFYGLAEGARYRGPDGAMRPMRTRPCEGLAGAIAFTTSPNLYTGEKAKVLAKIEASTRLLRFGLDAYAFVLVALGQADIAMEAGVQDHDIVPLVPIIEAAGGVIVDWRGNRAVRGGDVVAVGDPRLVPSVVAAIEAAYSR